MDKYKQWNNLIIDKCRNAYSGRKRILMHRWKAEYYTQNNIQYIKVVEGEKKNSYQQSELIRKFNSFPLHTFLLSDAT